MPLSTHERKCYNGAHILPRASSLGLAPLSVQLAVRAVSSPVPFLALGPAPSCPLPGATSSHGNDEHGDRAAANLVLGQVGGAAGAILLAARECAQAQV